MSNDLNSNFEALFGKMENFVSSKTVVGEPIHIGEVIILPLVDVVFGAGSGTGAGGADGKNNSAGAGGLGAKITPSAVIVIQNGNVQMVNVRNQDSLNKLIDMAPGILDKLGVTELLNKAKSRVPGSRKPDPEAPKIILTETGADTSAQQ